MTRIERIVFLGVAVALSACFANGGDSPPEISNLTSDVDVIPLDEISVLDGSFDFFDPDRDVELLAIAITTPSGDTGQIPPGPVTGVSGETEGTINWSLYYEPPEKGPFDFDIWVIDDNGNESNRLTAGFQAGFNCATTSEGCECSATGPDTIDQCNEDSVSGVCCRTAIPESCECREQVCIDDSPFGDCTCANRRYAETTNGVEVPSCASGGDVHCCLADGGITFGGVCTCRDNECLAGIETEVPSCAVSIVKDCGRNENVDLCQ